MRKIDKEFVSNQRKAAKKSMVKSIYTSNVASVYTTNSHDDE